MKNDHKGCFVNFSNHPLENWTDAQKNAAAALAEGPLTDLPFPQVSADADEAAVAELAEQYAAEIIAMHPAAVMCMGEFGVCFQVVHLLKQYGIQCVYSCAERQVTEQKTPDGTRKYVCFVFRRFRYY